MTLSAVSNATLAKNHFSDEKTGTDTDTEQTEKSCSKPSTEKNISRDNFDDNVKLSQSEKKHDSSKVVDKKAVEILLPQTMKSILARSNTAISAQANTPPRQHKNFLSKLKTSRCPTSSDRQHPSQRLLSTLSSILSTIALAQPPSSGLGTVNRRARLYAVVLCHGNTLLKNSSATTRIVSLS